MRDQILFGIHKWKRPLGRPRYRWRYNIRMNLVDVGWEGVNWILMVRDG
jgi:hypothetical protein